MTAGKSTCHSVAVLGSVIGCAVTGNRGGIFRHVSACEARAGDELQLYDVVLGSFRREGLPELGPTQGKALSRGRCGTWANRCSGFEAWALVESTSRF